MAALTPTKNYGGEFSGNVRLYTFTVTPTTATDTVTFTAATAGFTTIVGIVCTHIASGQASTFQTAHATYSGLVVTINTANGAGSAATTWGPVTVTMLVQD